MLKHARELSDIRSSTSPAFRLNATFSFVGKDLTPVEGSFTEVWVSDSRCRRETVVKDMHRVEVIGPTRRWLLDGTDEFPERAARVATELQFLPSTTGKFQFASIDDHSDKDPPYQCAVTKRSSYEEVYGFCFDKKTGILVESAFPELRPGKLAEPLRPVEHTCSYGSFKPFGKYWFPREVECLEDGHKEITIEVTELSLESLPEPVLFTPPAGAVEYVNCRGTLVPPKSVTTPEPRLPGVTTTPRRVLVSAMIDPKGHPQNVKVINGSGSKGGDGVAIETVRAWRFKPATCDGEAVPYPMKLELEFELFR